MTCLAAHDREGDARHFIDDKLEGLGLHGELHDDSGGQTGDLLFGPGIALGTTIQWGL